MRFHSRPPSPARLAFWSLPLLVALFGAIVTSAGAGTASRSPLSQRLAAPARVALTPAASGTSSGAGRPSEAVNARTTPPLSPAALHSAYALPTRGAQHQVIAVISAYHDPAAQADLTAFSKRFGLPPCTVANHCFSQLNGQGKSSPFPSSDVSGGQWTTESALGIEMAHAVCQSCRVALLEADQPDEQDLSTAVASAARIGATVVSTSFNLGENSLETHYSQSFAQPSTAIVSAAGDGGYSGTVTFPASADNVLAVGGTQLSLGPHDSYAGEQAWKETVSGCSSFEPVPSWQTQDAAKVDCPFGKAVADVAAVAAPGAIVHITGSGMSGGPWFVATGTSVGAPVIAGVIGLAGSAGSGEVPMLYRHAQTEPGAFHDIVAGADAADCSNPICKGVKGYDGPTGLGTPFGLAAFMKNGGALNARHVDFSVSVPGRPPRLSGTTSARLNIRNSNAFAVAGKLTLRRLSGGRAVTLSPATAFKLRPLGAGSVKLTILAPQRAALKALGSATLQAVVTLTGSAGKSVRFTRSLGTVATH